MNNKINITIEEKAREWFLLINSGSATDQHYEAFELWLEQDVQHKMAFAEVRSLWTDLDLIDEVENLLPEPDDSHSNAPLFQWTTKFRGVAAAILVLVSGVIFANGAFQGWFAQENVASPQSNEDKSLSFATLTGEIETIELPDGSLVKLDAESELTVSFSNHIRQANLLKGRAYFDIAKEQSRPFVVDTGENLVSVRGTAFDIRKSNRDVRVSVVEGVVDVSKAKGPDNDVLVQLLPGKQMLARLDGSLKEVRPFDADKLTGWTNGHLSFSQARLEDIIIDANKYRENKIVLSEQSIGDLHFTTSFGINQSDQMLEGVVYVHGLKISRYEDVTILSRN